MVIGPSGVSMTLTHTNAGALEICGCGRLRRSGGAGVSDEIPCIWEVVQSLRYWMEL